MDYEPIDVNTAVYELSVWIVYGICGVLCLLGMVHAAAAWGLV